MTHPDCMTESEYADWLTSVRATRCIESPCDCCTTKYQQAMTAAGRCHPAAVLMAFAYRPAPKPAKTCAGKPGNRPVSIAQTATN
jgi:hypothetical protein